MIKKYFNDIKREGLFKSKILFPLVGIVLACSVSLPTIYMSSNRVKEEKITIADNVAEQYFYEVNYTKAIEEYEKLLEIDDSPMWLVKISEIYSVQGSLENSRNFISRAKELRNGQIKDGVVTKKEDFKEKDSDLLNYIIFNEFMNKDYEASLKDGEEALNLYPTNKNIIKTMFTVYMANKQIDKAKALISSYPLDKESAYDMAEYARMLTIVDKWNEAFDYLKEAWNKDKDEYKVFDFIAQIAAYNKDSLIEKITALINKNPSETSYKMWLAKIYSMKSETSEEATKILEEVKDRDIGKIEPNLIRASILQNIKEPEAADEMIDRIISDNNSDYRVLHTAAWYYFNKKNYNVALNYCKQSILKNKNYPDNYGFLMPEIMKAMNKSHEGEPYFRTAMRKEPYNYNIMVNIANYYWHTTQDSDKALEYFKFAEMIKPNDGEVKYNMAMIHINNKREDDAISLLKDCIKIDESVPKYHRTLGTLYMIKGNMNEGIKETRAAYQADKNDILNLNNAGIYYITVEENLDRGFYNIKRAYESIVEETDKYTKDVITENYNKAKKLVDDYNNSSGNENLKVPDFTLFY